MGPYACFSIISATAAALVPSVSCRQRASAMPNASSFVPPRTASETSVVTDVFAISVMASMTRFVPLALYHSHCVVHVLAGGASYAFIVPVSACGCSCLCFLARSLLCGSPPRPIFGLQAKDPMLPESRVFDPSTARALDACSEPTPYGTFGGQPKLGHPDCRLLVVVKLQGLGVRRTGRAGAFQCGGAEFCSPAQIRLPRTRSSAPSHRRSGGNDDRPNSGSARPNLVCLPDPTSGLRDRCVDACNPQRSPRAVLPDVPKTCSVAQRFRGLMDVFLSSAGSEENCMVSTMSGLVLIASGWRSVIRSWALF